MATAPLDDVVVADRAFVEEAADAVEILGSGAPGLFRLTRRAAEAPVVIGQEAAEDLVGGMEINGASQAKFAGKAILEGAPQALDAAIGLWAAGGDIGDAELIEGACQAALAMGGSPALTRGAGAGPTQQATQGLTAQG